MATRFQVRRDTAAAWTAANPTLAAGEWALETDSKRIKVGDGTTAWTSLPYQIAGPTSATDNALARYDGTTGRLLQNTAATVDDNGRLTVPAGATGGVSLGGPLQLTGTGSPEGAVTAGVGSTWTQTDSTVGVLRWVKAGAGNTGWKVDVGDTGRRDITALLTNPANGTLSQTYLRRIGGQVFLSGRMSSTAATSGDICTLPVGFRPGVQATVRGGAQSATDQPVLVTVANTGVITVRTWNTSTSNRYWLGSWPTDDAWPTVLPGS